MGIFNCDKNSNVQRRFIYRMYFVAGLCILGSLIAVLTLRLTHWRGLPAYPIAVLPALPILWAIYETGRYLNDEKDEFMRNLLVQCMLGGIGGCLGVTTTWGYLTDFARAPQMDLIWVYPIFWLCVMISYPVVKARYK
jgi:hypothetical protein